MTLIQVRRGTSTQWSTTNPILTAGEVGWDTTLFKMKVGDGTTAWNSLSFLLASDINSKAPLNSPTFTGTVSGITKTMVGLGNVDNTTDVAKPVSTATQTALDGKASTSHVHAATDISSGTLPDARLATRLGTIAATVTDWNSATTNGWYMGNSATNSPPLAGWFIGTVDAHNGTYYTQTVHQFTGDGSADTKSYRRSCEAGTWGAWYKLMLSQAEQDARYQLLIPAGVTSQYYRGDKSWQTLDKTAVGLSNVDNTTDAAKPISSATNSALSLKLDAVQKANANGVASLGADGRVPAAQLPTVAGGTVNSMTGTYAGRPAANAVSIGAVYYATDVYEQYRSDGTAWSVVGNGGNERGSATITALQSTSNGVAGPVDIVGMTTTFVAGERPVRIVLDCDMTNSSATNITTVQILLNDVQLYIVNSTASNSTYIWQSLSKGIRKAGLTPGGIYTARARLYVTGGIGYIGGATDNPSTLSVISL